MQRHQQPLTMSIDFVRDELVRYYNDKHHSPAYRKTQLDLWKQSGGVGGPYREAYLVAVKRIEANHGK